MNRTPIFHSVMLQEDTWARVYVNDVPLYKGAFVGPDARSGPVNYLLRSGDNEVSVELLKTKKLHHAPHLKDAFFFELYEVMNPDVPNPETARIERRTILEIRFPEMWEQAREEHRRYPFHMRATFDPGVALHEPLFFRAEPASFGCEGTDELRAAVARLHNLLEVRAYEAFLDELALKLREDELALAGVDLQRAQNKRQTFREDLFAYEPRPAPLAPETLHFEPRAGGRVAFVTRHDGGYALDAVCEKDPKRRLRTDLLMTRHQGRWQIFA
jgi:hypothetical protein